MKTGQSGSSTLKSGPSGISSYSTMIVMVMAMTPSLKASRRFFPTPFILQS
jgi:hypothetical protein